MHACKKIENLINAYLDGELSVNTKVELDKHLTSCHACHQKVDDFTQVKLALSDTTNMIPSVNFNDQVIKQVHQAFNTEPTFNYWILGLAASLLIALILPFLVINNIEPEPQFILAKNVEIAGLHDISPAEFNQWTSQTVNIEYACVNGCDE